MYTKQLSRNFIPTLSPVVTSPAFSVPVQNRDNSAYADSHKIRVALESTIVSAINSTANAAVETTKKYIWQTFGSETNLIAAIVSICTTILGLLSLLIAGLAKFWAKIKDCSCCRSILPNSVRRFARDVELGQNHVNSTPARRVLVDHEVNLVHNGRSFVNYEHEGELYGTPVAAGNDLSMDNISPAQS